MPFTQQLLFTIPSLWLGVVIIGSSVLLSVVGLIIVRRFISHHTLKSHNDVAGAIFGTLGMAYTVLLAFVVVIVWGSFDKSSENIEKEANRLADLYRDAQAFQEQARDEVHSLCNEYACAIVGDEWDTLAKGEESLRAQAALKKLWSFYSVYTPKTVTQKVFFEQSVRKLNDLSELRRQRLFDSKNGIEPILWFVLVVGGILTIAFTVFFGSDNFMAQLIMTSILAAMIALILFTILLFDFPFTGDVKISPAAFQQVFSCDIQK